MLSWCTYEHLVIIIIFLISTLFSLACRKNAVCIWSSSFGFGYKMVWQRGIQMALLQTATFVDIDLIVFVVFGFLNIIVFFFNIFCCFICKTAFKKDEIWIGVRLMIEMGTKCNMWNMRFAMVRHSLIRIMYQKGIKNNRRLLKNASSWLHSSGEEIRILF